jgi:hypothetical protein
VIIPLSETFNDASVAWRVALLVRGRMQLINTITIIIVVINIVITTAHPALACHSQVSTRTNQNELNRGTPVLNAEEYTIPLFALLASQFIVTSGERCDGGLASATIGAAVACHKARETGFIVVKIHGYK